MMNNLLNPQLLKMFKTGNPQQIAMDFLKQNANGNPILQNVMSMVNSGDTKGIESVCRNLCANKGIDPDALMSQIKQMME